MICLILSKASKHHQNVTIKEGQRIVEHLIVNVPFLCQTVKTMA